MYKKQLTWQKILCFAALAACALIFLYSLGMSTDLYDGLFYTLPEEAKLETAKINVPGAEIYYHIQPFNRALLNNSIALLLLACLLFITSTHSRRRYYVGNIVATVAWAAAGTGISVWAHVQSELWKAEFLKVDFKSLEMFAKMMKKPYIDSTFWFDAHYVVLAILLVVCAALVINYFWKLHLMKAEKRLINAGKGEAAV